MPLIAYSEFVSRVKQQVFPDTEGSLEPINLAFPHTTYIQNGLIQAQTYVDCLKQNNVQTYSLDDAMVNCGVAIFDLPEHAMIGAVYAYKPAKGCTRKHYTQQSVNKIMCFVDQFAQCECRTESDICNAVRSGDAVCDNLAVCEEWDEDEGEDDTSWLCQEKIFAVGAGGKLYVAPRMPCGYRLAVHWTGVKRRYADADLIADDPDLLDLVSTYVQAERARTFDRDIPLWKELFGNGPSRGGRGGSAWHEKLASLHHRCQEERRIRTRPCLEMWDDSAVSSENIGPNLDPVPARNEEDVVFERCDGCEEGQILIYGECVDCLTPIVSISADDESLVPGQAVTITWNSSNVIDLASSHVTLEYDGNSIELTPNEGGSITFTPTADTTYTIRANTVCGEDVTASVSVVVSEDVDGCPCPTGLADCLRISDFDANTFTDRIRFAYIADYGDPANSPHPEDVETQVQAFSPDYLISGGDNKYSVTMDEVFDLLPYYGSLRDAERMYSVAQNHDAVDGGGIADYLAAFPYFPGDQRNYSKRLGPVEFFFRETHSTGNPPSGAELAASAAWLEAAVAASTARWKVVVTGDAPHTSVNNADYPGHVESQLDYAGMGVHLVLSGDSHNGERIELGGVTYIVGGTSGRTLSGFNVTPVTGSEFRISDYGFWGIEADGESLVGQFIDDSGTVQDTFTLTSDEGAIECVEGTTSIAEAWDGTLERVEEDACLWGFGLNQKSLGTLNVSAFILLDHCEDDGTLVYRLQVLIRTADGADILWNGLSHNTPIGTYVRDDSLTCGPLTVEVAGCEDCDEVPTVEFDPPSGSSVSFPTFVFLTASDESALIYYTTDGSEPTNNSTLYTGAISLVNGDVLKARAYTAECIGEVHEADYEAIQGFQFEFVCDTADRAGEFFEFAANGSNDYHWALNWALLDTRTVKRLEIYEVNSEGVWVTGQAWATQNPVQPAELEGADFSIYPLVIVEYPTNNQLNNAYTTELGTFAAQQRSWQMYGQPFIPLVGYFKLLFVMDDGAGGEETIYKLIPHDCYYSEDYYYYDDDPDFEPPTGGPASPNIINVDIRETGTSTKHGAAAVGLSGDYWNTLNFNPDGEPGEVTVSEITPLKWASGIDSPASLIESHEANSAISIFMAGEETGSTDPMMANAGRVASDGWYKRLFFGNLPRGVYDVYVYGHGENTPDVLHCRVLTPAQSTEWKSTSAVENWDGAFSEPINYVSFENISFLQIEATDLVVELRPEFASWICGVQLVKKA